MNIKISTLAFAFAALASQNDGIDSINFVKNNEPDWKRKKCKSCKKFVNRSWSCSSNPNKQACEKYTKRK